MFSRMVLALVLIVTLAASKAGAQDKTPAEIYKQALPSVMTLEVTKKDGSEYTGTAFLAFKENLAVTAWHVVSNAKKVVARFSNGEEFDASGLVDRDEKRDVALIRVKVVGRSILTLIQADPEVGSKAYVIGAPKGLEFSISDGLVSQIQTDEGVKFYQFSCPASPGNSGGPLINTKGEVIGVVSRQIKEGQNLNFAMPAKYAMALDSTLPTQPWDGVKVETAPEKASAGGTVESNDEALDRWLAKSLMDIFDASTILEYTAIEVTRVHKDGFLARMVTRKGTFKADAPPKLYELRMAVALDEGMLKQMSSSDPLRAKVLADLTARLQLGDTALELALEGIQKAGADNAWTPAAKDMIGRAAGTSNVLREIPRDDLKAMLTYKSFKAALSPAMIEQLTQEPISPALGAEFWMRDELVLVLVMKNSLASRLGLRTGDVLGSADGKELATPGEFKAILRSSAGKRIKLKVTRDGNEREFEANVPKELPMQ